ncbi:MAG TPA: glycosyltransferase [Verrucomicrobiae bacterium]|jgi:poly(glycerol-phosphate) alpha-glucosyltransferase
MIKSANLTASVSRKAGGLFEAILRQVQSHDRQKFDARVFGLWDEFSDADKQAWSPVPVAAFKPSEPKLLGYAPQFREELLAFEPDLCHTHGLWLYPSVAAKNYSRKKGRPYLISPHGMLDPWALKNSRWKKQIAYALFEKSHLRGARCLRALCASEASSIRQLGLKNGIAIIPNGIDLPKNPPTSPAPWAGNIEPGKKVLLFLSRIHPKKGLVNLLKAWAKNQKPEVGSRNSAGWVLAIAGWDQGGHEAELKRLCAELQIPFADVREPATGNRQPATVLFLGPQFNGAKAACYHHCDAFILPSFSEGLPMVVLEAWANAKPVVMTPECNLPEGFQVGAAIKVETDEASMAAGLNELFCMTAEERATMGNRARNLVVEKFTWPRVAGQVEEVYEWMLGGGAKPGCLADF